MRSRLRFARREGAREKETETGNGPRPRSPQLTASQFGVRLKVAMNRALSWLVVGWLATTLLGLPCGMLPATAAASGHGCCDEDKGSSANPPENCDRYCATSGREAVVAGNLSLLPDAAAAAQNSFTDRRQASWGRTCPCFAARPHPFFSPLFAQFLPPDLGLSPSDGRCNPPCASWSVSRLSRISGAAAALRHARIHRC